MMNFFSFSLLWSQAAPVKWTFETKKISEDKIQLIAVAAMDKDWVIYSQFTEDGGPIPTSFEIDGTETKFVENDKATVEFDALFEINVSKFKKTATFILEGNKSMIGKSASVTYMTCDGARCLAPKTVDFSIK